MVAEFVTRNDDQSSVTQIPSQIVFYSVDKYSWKLKNDLPKKGTRPAPRPQFDPESYLKLELGAIKEVEQVIVTGETLLRVLIVINERNYLVQEKIYPIEMAVMNAYPHLRFDFHILSRMNRNLKDVLQSVGKNVFTR